MISKAFTLLELLIVITIIGILAAIAVPMYTSYTARARFAEVPVILKDIVKFQFLHRDYPGNNGKYASGLMTIGIRTSRGTFASAPEGCQTSTIKNSDETNIYACSQYYAFSTSSAKAGVTCSDNGIGNFSWAHAINTDEVLVNDIAACMTEDFFCKHGSGE